MRNFLAAAFTLALIAPAFAETPKARELQSLFGKLAKAQSSEEPKPIEEDILSHFLRSDSATVDLLMSRASALADAKDEGSALRILDAVTHIAPSYAEGWHQKGKLEADAGKD